MFIKGVDRAYQYLLQIRWRQTQHAQEHQPKPLMCLMRTPLGDFRVIWKHALEKIVGSEWGKRKYPARRCHVCAFHKQGSETWYICKFCLVPLHKGECFQRYYRTLKHY